MKTKNCKRTEKSENMVSDGEGDDSLLSQKNSHKTEQKTYRFIPEEDLCISEGNPNKLKITSSSRLVAELLTDG